MTPPEMVGVFIGRGWAIHAAPLMAAAPDAPGAPLCGQRGRRYRTGGAQAVNCKRCLSRLPKEKGSVPAVAAG